MEVNQPLKKSGKISVLIQIIPLELPNQGNSNTSRPLDEIFLSKVQLKN